TATERCLNRLLQAVASGIRPPATCARIGEGDASATANQAVTTRDHPPLRIPRGWIASDERGGPPPMKVLVTGAAGRIAQAVIDELLPLGHSVRGIDVQPQPRGDVEWMESDIRDLSSTERACAGMDAVL